MHGTKIIINLYTEIHNKYDKNFIWESDNIMHATIDGEANILKTIMNSKHPYLSITLNFLLWIGEYGQTMRFIEYIKSKKLGDLKFN